MNNRLSIPDIAGLLVEYTGKDKKKAELFLKEFTAIVRETLLIDKIVKINGIGTFKIIQVERRESVHVNTGERIVIPEHSKFSFTPDKDLKERVNQPFSLFETIELGDHIDFSSINEQTEKSVDQVSEFITPEEPVESEEKLPVPSLVEQPDEPEIISQLVTPDNEKGEEPEKSIPEKENVLEGKIEIEVKDNTPETPEKNIAPEEIIPVVIPIPNTKPEQLEQEEEISSTETEAFPVAHNKNSLPKILAFLSVVLILGIGLIVYLNNKGETKTENGIASVIEEKQEISEPENSVLQNDPVVSDVPEEILIDEPEQQPVAPKSDVIARVKIEPGSRLTLLALEYYGHKFFWVYIYEYNKSIIKDPNNIPIGTEILIPAPELYGINAKERSSLDKAIELQAKLQCDSE